MLWYRIVWVHILLCATRCAAMPSIDESTIGEDDLFSVEEDQPEPTPSDGKPWNVLIVDDDPDVHEITRLNLRRVRFRGRPLGLIHVLSSATARAVLRQISDVALALIDVVMETEHAGLELIQFIRGETNNRAIRLIVRTGQPGRAPQEKVIDEFEIDGYAAKTELTAVKLVSTVITALRSYEAVAELAAQNEELQERVIARTHELERLMMIDPLSGLANRRHFEARASSELTDARAVGMPLTLCTLDIDHFKEINDAHGAAAGDMVLQQVAQAISIGARPGDLVARVSGEAFAIVMPHSKPEEVRILAERIRQAVEAVRIPIGEASITPTMSIGIACVADTEDDFAPALARAHEALHRARHMGGNQLMVA